MSGAKFSEDELRKALRDFEELMERVLCKFVVLGDTAKAVYEERDLYGGKVQVGVFKREVTEFVKSTLKTLLENVEFTDRGFTYESNGVPVEVKYISTNYKFFKNPDFKFYKTGQYYFANPFENYWKARGLIK